MTQEVSGTVDCSFAEVKEYFSALVSQLPDNPLYTADTKASIVAMCADAEEHARLAIFKSGVNLPKYILNLLSREIRSDLLVAYIVSKVVPDTDVNNYLAQVLHVNQDLIYQGVLQQASDYTREFCVDGGASCFEFSSGDVVASGMLLDELRLLVKISSQYSPLHSESVENRLPRRIVS